MNSFARLVMREIRLAWTGGGLWLPVIFYLAVATLYPFVTGPDKVLLAKTGGGILWIAALLSTLLPIERLILPDRQAGVLDQLAIRGWSDELVAAVKITGQLVAFAIPLLLASIIASALIGLPEEKLMTLLLGLAVALPALSGLSVTISALTAGLNGASALGGLLLIPLAIPILIFGAGTLSDVPGNAMQLLAATSIAIAALSPFAAGAALRAGRV
ncbi:heme exporter protein CcmB [Sphingorhabdus contaminans]|uniref:Heme exporter protein B n=1 Tax=Sphingorhabdus contaminans TaxID=1343899 RepID=A0A553WJL1_9SPHN|nr:heme exporter protein CcmB [Sphingorhabdus contaminans]TSB04821.1 heme ABC transporter permease CcmB [Sphingorhabdus contaminans]